jgi:hypothetical protein
MPDIVDSKRTNIEFLSFVNKIAKKIFEKIWKRGLSEYKFYYLRAPKLRDLDR